VFPSEIVHHLGCDGGTRSSVCGLIIAGSETGEEGRSEVVDDGSETLVLV
jgi:hypothetical protein